MNSKVVKKLYHFEKLLRLNGKVKGTQLAIVTERENHPYLCFKLTLINKALYMIFQKFI